jgi:hypothetical protein
VALLLAALASLRFAHQLWGDWQREISSTFDYTAAWGTWLAAIALLALTGLLVGVASLPDIPRGYSWAMPLIISVPAILLLAHFVVLMEDVAQGRTDLPGPLGHFMFYMDGTAQFVIAVVAGFGIAAGLRSSGEAGTAEQRSGPLAP